MPHINNCTLIKCATNKERLDIIAKLVKKRFDGYSKALGSFDTHPDVFVDEHGYFTTWSIYFAGLPLTSHTTIQANGIF